MSEILQNSFNYKCSLCGGVGKLPRFEENEVTRKIYGDGIGAEFAYICPNCAGGHAVLVQAKKTRSRIPCAYSDATLASFNWDIYEDDAGNKIDTSKARDVVETFVDCYKDVYENSGIGIYIHSTMCGSGKTFLASCICNTLMSKYPMTTKFVSESELIDIKQNGFEVGSAYESDPIGLLCNCKLLVIDDLGQKKAGREYVNDILFRILDHRTQNGLATIITSNVDVYSIGIERRIADRVNEMCMSIKLPEYCVRSKNGKEKQKELYKKAAAIRKQRKGKAL